MITNYNSGAAQEVEVGDEVVRFVTILDPHFSPVNPSSRKDDFVEATEDAFGQAVRFGIKVKASAVIIAGDIFHLKSGTKNPHKFVRSLMGLFKSVKASGMDLLVIAGNHDLTYGSLISLKDQPLGVLIEADAAHLLDYGSVTYKAKGFSVKVAGSSYSHAQAAPVRDLKKGEADFLVGVGHFWFGPETGEFFGEPVYGPNFFDSSEVDAFVIGHHHADQGIPVVGGKTYFAHGSMNRIGSHKGDLERRPAIGLLEVTSAGISGKVARLKVADVSEVFNLEVVKDAQIEQKELDQFIELIANQIVENADLGVMVEHMALPNDVRLKVNHYLELAEGELTK